MHIVQILIWCLMIGEDRFHCPSHGLTYNYPTMFWSFLRPFELKARIWRYFEHQWMWVLHFIRTRTIPLVGTYVKFPSSWQNWARDSKLFYIFFPGNETDNIMNHNMKLNTEYKDLHQWTLSFTKMHPYKLIIIIICKCVANWVAWNLKECLIEFNWTETVTKKKKKFSEVLLKLLYTSFVSCEIIWTKEISKFCTWMRELLFLCVCCDVLIIIIIIITFALSLNEFW